MALTCRQRVGGEIINKYLQRENSFTNIIKLSNMIEGDIMESMVIFGI